ncbi:MAG TPA: DsrE/DsrF/DrsH-like family protein [Williamwhitmania sp.]|nr:DsrE/DsrF/DrsH-like family protein [Williamwhitmania sp.]
MAKVMEGIEAGVSAMMKSQMEKLDTPTIEAFLEFITAGGGEIHTCKLAVDMFGLKKEDLSKHVVDIITIGQFYKLSAGQGTQIIFT